VTGLTNGTPYIFEVDASSTVGNSSWSAPSDPATPHVPPPPADNSVLSVSHSTTIKYGKTTVISGTLTDAKTSTRVSGAPVSLRARAGSSGPFTTLTSKNTTGTGAVTVTVKPNVNSQYEWVYAGNASHKQVTSSVATIKVAQVVTETLKPTKVKHRHAVAVYGTVTPKAKGKAVVLQRLVAGKWRKLAATTERKQKLPNGKTVIGYVFHYKPKRKGAVSLRVTRAATSTNAAGVSATKRLKVT
jgi:hypothetical protein